MGPTSLGPPRVPPQRPPGQAARGGPETPKRPQCSQCHQCQAQGRPSDPRTPPHCSQCSQRCPSAPSYPSPALPVPPVLPFGVPMAPSRPLPLLPAPPVPAGVGGSHVPHTHPSQCSQYSPTPLPVPPSAHPQDHQCPSTPPPQLWGTPCPDPTPHGAAEAEQDWEPHGAPQHPWVPKAPSVRGARSWGAQAREGAAGSQLGGGGCGNPPSLSPPGAARPSAWIFASSPALSHRRALT